MYSCLPKFTQQMLWSRQKAHIAIAHILIFTLSNHLTLYDDKERKETAHFSSSSSWGSQIKIVFCPHVTSFHRDGFKVFCHHQVHSVWRVLWSILGAIYSFFFLNHNGSSNVIRKVLSCCGFQKKKKSTVPLSTLLTYIHTLPCSQPLKRFGKHEQ